MTNAANEFLMAGGVSSAKFPAIGTRVTGTIVRHPEVQQQRDFTTGEPKVWDDGKPMQQLQVTLATSERDPQTPDDDGVRAIYVKGNMLKAVREAVRRSGAQGLEVSGTLTITYTGDGEASRRGINPPKLYAAEYTAAPAAAANSFLATEPTPAATPQPVQPATPAGVDPAVLAALAQLSPEQRALLNV
jgi:hypothetical protein